MAGAVFVSARLARESRFSRRSRAASMPKTALVCMLALMVAQAAALRFDQIPLSSGGSSSGGNGGSGGAVRDSDLQDYLRTSSRWLRDRAAAEEYPLLQQYAEQLALVLRSECVHCVDYYEAAGLLGLLGKSVTHIVQDNNHGTHQPVVRRSYLAAVWLLQRSRMFVWETTHLPNAALSAMFRLYMGHVHRAKGRTVSLHHISKCGGTTMCQLAASNRCSNPHLSQEKNCVLNDRLDGPLWMVGHHVTQQGVVLDPAIGTLDAEPAKPSVKLSPRMRFANEPKMDMWLMYACPYTPNGRIYNCKARAADARESGTTFVANERTLTQEDGLTQVCPEFVNTVILREPVPHAISIMAEVKYRYVRQMAVKHNIHSWQPSAWNLTWWGELGPALVGNYATRTLLGRQSFCRSAGNMSDPQLQQATDALLRFDVVMTLGRSHDIDLVITTLLGWPARNFSSQPGARVREVSVDLATKGQVAVTDSKASKGTVSPGRSLLAVAAADNADAGEEDAAAGHSSGHAGRSLLVQPRQNGMFHSTHNLQHGHSMKQPHHGQAGKQHAGKAKPKPKHMPAKQRQHVHQRGPHALHKALGAHGQQRHPSQGVPEHGQHSGLQPQRHHNQAPRHNLHPQPGHKPAAGGHHAQHAQHPQQQHAHGKPLPQHGHAAAATAHAKVAAAAALSAAAAVGRLPAGAVLGPMPAALAAGGAAVVPAEAAAAAGGGMAAASSPVPSPLPAVALSPAELERQGAVMLVTATWQERQAELLGVNDRAAVTAVTGEPHIEHTGQQTAHGAHLIRVTYSNVTSAKVTETWHSFPRHTFAFLDADMAQLEALTQLDVRLYGTATLMFDLDAVWLQAMLASPHYRKKLQGVAATYTSCGFAGMMPFEGPFAAEP